MAEHRAGLARHDFLLVSLLFLISAGIFWLDILIPLGVAAGVPYIAVVFLGAWLPWRHSIILLAAIGTTLTLLGYLFSESGGIAWMVVTNRGLALLAIWMTALLLTQRRGSEEALKAARDELQTRVVERTAELEKANADLQGLIAERVQAEKELRESEERFRAITEASPVPLIITRRSDGAILYANPKVGPALGLAADEVVGRSVTEFYGDPSGREERLAALNEDGYVRDNEIEMRKADGSLISTIHSLQTIEYQGEEAVLGGFYDITERKHLEEQLRQAQKMEAVGQLTGGVAHDFNNLLAIILGNAEIAEDRLGENDNSIKAIIRAAGRGAQLTQRLLAFSRRHPLDSRPIDLGALVGDVHQLLHRTLGETIDIDITMAPSLWNAMADPGQLENALLNLAINARDAMADGGKLIIEAANVSLSTNDATSHMEVIPGDYVYLSVRDTGVGMPPEVVERAFEPFFTTRDVGEGSGLGLSMVYGFAKQSGGDVTIESEPGHGTTVKLFLPRAKGSVEQPEPDDKPSVPRGRGEIVLVIEDEPDVLAMTEAMLEGLGYQVMSAEDARAGLDILQAEPAIDLILSDVMLPGGMSGPEMAEQARAFSPEIKVLFMSGHAEPSIHLGTPLPEGSDLLDKPFRKIELAQRVRAVLDR